jgi:Leucine-rich repeat (LRR) protein
MTEQSSIISAGDLECTYGNPWSVLPIKNNKYAKDLMEVHLSDRSINKLENFEDFPNLEVIWLNNNKVRNPNEFLH